MSDFDKEAEREKLREKYEQDQQEREATERMSDLLLKGATMTNAHCGTCGDPVFRYEGQEFCPTCQEVLRETEEAGTAAENGETPDRPAEATDDTETAATETQSEPESATTEVEVETETTTDVTTPDRQADPTPDDTTPAATQQRAQTQQPTAPDRRSSGRDEADAAASTGRPADVSPPPETPHASGAGLADARATLTATVTELATAARRSDDLERTRAYLAAVEEAADALAAVERADQ